MPQGYGKDIDVKGHDKIAKIEVGVGKAGSFAISHSGEKTKFGTKKLALDAHGLVYDKGLGYAGPKAKIEQAKKAAKVAQPQTTQPAA